MIEVNHVDNLVSYIRVLKRHTTYHIWKYCDSYLKRYFWKEKTFWSDGYFISFIENVSEQTPINYIENQV